MPADLPRAVLFDLDRALIDSRRAWVYALEEAVASTCGRRIDGRPLVDEYQHRPWAQVLAIVLDSPTDRTRAEVVCVEVTRRSALKKLLVFEGVGMALDSLQAASIEIGVASRAPHELALKQMQSTGLDRFVTVLAATPSECEWDAGARYLQCVNYLERTAPAAAVVTPECGDAVNAAASGFRVFTPGWVAQAEGPGTVVQVPGALLGALRLASR